ncbi:MAG: hypothetical protein M3O09_10360 [Acidobacteriota bacterium]|nr:hypothetical protein [Acidobacteriota bacterium]
MTEQIATAAIELGHRKAQEILGNRDAALNRRTAALQRSTKISEFRVHSSLARSSEVSSTVRTAGFLIAAGDSWFDYPLHDVLKILDDDHGFNIESAAHKGDAIEKMAYRDGQLDDFARKLDKILAQGAAPKAALLSRGGDDIAGHEFGMLLNNAFSPIAGWDKKVIDGLVNDRIMIAYVQMLSALDQICKQRVGRQVPILIHGYDYPIPDGRGFWGGWPFPGPWLEPGFREKNFRELPLRTELMRDLIDNFNGMLSNLVSLEQFRHIRYIDLRGTLPASDYQTWWENELHPTRKGFAAISQKFADVLNALK